MPSSPPSPPSSPFAIPAFRLIWAAMTISFLGSFVQDVAERWLILGMTKSPLPSALMSTFFTTASMLVMLPAGLLADRRDRRRIVIASQVLQAAFAAVLAILTLTGRLSPAALLAGAAFLGFAMGLGQPAWAAMLPELVSRELVAEAIALNAIAFNIARALGPAVGGLVLGGLGPTASFVLNAASFVVAALAILAWRTGATTPPPSKRPAAPIARALVEPIRLAAVDRKTRATILAMLLFTCGGAMVYALAPAFGRRTLGASATEYGLLFGAMGAGAIAGTFLFRPLRRRVAPRLFVSMTALLYAASALALARAPNVRVAILLYVPAGAGWTGTFSSLSTLVQLWTPDRLRARIVAVYTIGHFAMWGAASAVGGALADHGIRMTMTIGACIAAVAGAVTARLPLPASFVGPPTIIPTPLPVSVREGA